VIVAYFKILFRNLASVAMRPGGLYSYLIDTHSRHAHTCR